MQDTCAQLTVIIPLYNDATYIRETVLSCIGEAGLVAIYDNASTDGSSEICAELARQYDNVRHIRHPSNIGAFENMQKALQECDTPYFCFVGSHDLLTPGYTAAMLGTLTVDPTLQLAQGTIQHIDEQGRLLPDPTKPTWINESRRLPTLTRVGVFVKKLRDCFLYYGVWRTEAARAVWTPQPVLGFDRFIIIRAAARGPIAWVPNALFLARDFPATRNGKEDRERRSHILTHSSVAKSNFTRNHEIAKTVLSLATNDAELTEAFAILETLNRRLHNRKYYQRRRLVMIIGGVLTLILMATLAWL